MSVAVGAGFTILAALALAVQSLAIRSGTRTRGIADVVAIMFVINLLVLVPVAWVVESPVEGLSTVAVGAFALAGLLGSLAARLCYFVGIVRLGASRAEPLKALFPVFAVAIAVVTLGEAVTPRLLLGVGLLVAGGVGVAGEARASPVTSSGGRVWVDVAFPVAGALFLGVDPVLTKVGLAEGTPPLVGLVVRIGAAAAGFGLYAAWRTLRRERGWRRPNRWLLVAGVANTGYLLAYYGALSRAPVAVVTPLLGVSTLFVVAGAGLFLQADERVTWRLAAAALVVVIGAAVVVGG